MFSLTVDTQQSHSTDTSLDTAAVFEGTSFEDLSRDIGILTSTLAHLPASPPTSSGRSPGSAKGTGKRARKDGDNGVSSLLGHISTLLTVSTAGDKYVATVNAVIGQYEPGGGISVVVSYNGKVAADPSTSPRTPSLQPVLIGDDQRARDLLDPDQSSQMRTETLAIEDHLRDVGTVLAYVLKASLSQRKSLVADDLFFGLFCFIMCRAHVKLGARLSNMEQFWNKKNPVQIMLDSWAVDGTPHFNDVVDVPRVGLYIQLLKKHHFVSPHFDPQTDKLFVTTENAKHWLQASIEVLNALKSALCDDTGKPVACPSFEQIRDILLASVHLEFILRSFFQIVSNKAPHNVEEELQSNYTAGMETRLRKRAVWRKVQAGELPAVPDIASGNDEEITLMDSPIQESGESSVSHVQRFLRTLTAWYTACTTLFYTVRQVASLSLFSFHTGVFFPILLAFREHYRAYAMSRYATLCESPTAQTQIDLFLDSLLPKRELNVVTHAEAGLMALVLDQRSHHAVVKLPMGDGDLNALFSASGRMDIGVSKKCCYCCDILAKLINASAQGDLAFSFPETHGTIFPWLPPPFGVTTEYLQQIRDKLFKEFNDIVATRMLNPASTPSSPVSDHEGLPEEPFREDWLEQVFAKRGHGAR